MRQEEQEPEKERVSLGQREGSVEAGKSEEREGHNKRRKMCVLVFAYCSGPTYPAILLRRQSPEEEEEEEDSGIPSLGQQHTHTSSLCSSHTHTAP